MSFGSDLNAEEQQCLYKHLLRYRKLFLKKVEAICRVMLPEDATNTVDAKPVNCPPYRIFLRNKQILKKKC